MTAPLPVAVIGAGRMGGHHVRLYSQMPQVKLVAVVDADIERARAAAEPVGAKWATELTPDLGDIAAVSVATPTAYHLAVSRPLIERGVSVLIEKPLAGSPEEAEEIAALAKRHDVLVAVGHTERFNPAVRAVHRLGVRAKYVESSRVSPFPFRSADVGVVFDIMIHDIDVLLSLVPEDVARVDAVGVNVLGAHEDVASARITFAGGAVANLTASRLALKTERRLRVFSERAYVSLDYHHKQGIAVTLDKNADVIRFAQERGLDDLSQLAGADFKQLVKVEPLLIDNKDALGTELETFIDCVRNRSKPPVSVEDGVRAVRVAARIVEKIKSHRWDGDEAGRVGLAADIVRGEAMR
ncbi:MAG: Gfo/Idh/MocA family oxidoreductase [Phycisphaerales bacterium]|nr:Gfo/Idh/MocA family oxidoreductase [Phycisphaerales bacterium]